MAERAHASHATPDLDQHRPHVADHAAPKTQFSARGPKPPVAETAADGSQHQSASDRAERAELIAQTRSHLGNAYAAFTGACVNVRIDLLQAASEDADMMAAVGGVLFSLALPGFGALAGAALGKLANVAPHLVHFLHSNEKIIEEAVKGTAEIGLEAFKSHTPQVKTAESDGDFISELNLSTHIGIEAMQDSLPSRSTEEIAGVWAAYDATVANMPAFTAKIHRLVQAFHSVKTIGHSQVRKFGRGGDVDRLTERTILAYVGDPNVAGNRLAVVKQLDGLGGAGAQYTIEDYVPDELREMAIKNNGGGEPATYDPRTNQLTHH